MRYMTVKAVDANTLRVCTIRQVEASAVRDAQSPGMEGSAVMIDAGSPRLNAGDRFGCDYGNAFEAVARWHAKDIPA